MIRAMDERGVERAQFALSALLEGHRRVATADDAAALAIDTWNLLLGASNARTILADVPASRMSDLREWMVAAISRDAGLPPADVQASLDRMVGWPPA